MSNKINRQIRTGNDPVLKTVCTAVKPDEDVSHIVDRLTLVVRKCRGAVGLAAPQIGITRRLIVTYCKNDRGSIVCRVMINPEIIEASTAMVVSPEGCLSYPDVGEKPIARHEHVTIKWEDTKRRPQQQTFHGFEAIVCQHEIDHTFGVCKVGDPNYVAPHSKTTDRIQAHCDSVNGKSVTQFGLSSSFGAIVSNILSSSPSRR